MPIRRIVERLPFPSFFPSITDDVSGLVSVCLRKRRMVMHLHHVSLDRTRKSFWSLLADLSARVRMLVSPFIYRWTIPPKRNQPDETKSLCFVFYYPESLTFYLIAIECSKSLLAHNGLMISRNRSMPVSSWSVKRVSKDSADRFLSVCESRFCDFVLSIHQTP